VFVLLTQVLKYEHCFRRLVMGHVPCVGKEDVETLSIDAFNSIDVVL